MNYIILDLEWNQPFSKKRMVREPVCLEGEIIQFGAVKMDESFRLVGTFKIGIRPKHYTKMMKKVKQLTKITTKDLELGFPFPVGFAHFQKWCGEDIVLLTWGDDDIPILRSNMRLHEINVAWLPKTYNVQAVFGGQITKDWKQYSLSRALELTGEEALTAHDALHDAINTFRVLGHLDLRRGMEMLDKGVNPMEHGRKTKCYETKALAKADAELRSVICAECGRTVVCTGWIRQNAKKMIGMGVCSCRQEYLFRLRFAANSDQTVRVGRITPWTTTAEPTIGRSKKRAGTTAAPVRQQSWMACSNDSGNDWNSRHWRFCVGSLKNRLEPAV